MYVQANETTIESDLHEPDMAAPDTLAPDTPAPAASDPGAPQVNVTLRQVYY